MFTSSLVRRKGLAQVKKSGEKLEISQLVLAILTGPSSKPGKITGIKSILVRVVDTRLIDQHTLTPAKVVETNWIKSKVSIAWGFSSRGGVVRTRREWDISSRNAPVPAV
jgi:hypothetical protein